MRRVLSLGFTLCVLLFSGSAVVQYVEGARTHGVVSRYVGQDLAYVVMRETIKFKRPTDRREMVQDLRVTQVFRNEGGRWRIVRRHAGSETTKQTNG